MRYLALVVILAVGACSPRPSEQQVNIYAREARLSKNPAFKATLSSTESEFSRLAWIAGAWRVETTVFATADTTARRTLSVATFTRRGAATLADERLSTIMGYDPFAKAWWVGGIELPEVAAAGGYGHWDGRRMTVEFTVRIFGEPYRLRQTLTRTGPDTFEVLNEQRLRDGRFHPVDLYRYARLTGVDPGQGRSPP